MDGCKFHRSAETLAWMTHLGMNVIVAGQYGFQGSPVEKVFGYLKQVDLNPSNLKTGKK